MSDDKTEEIKKNILSPSQWTRILFMVLYGLAWWLVTMLLIAIVVIQALISLVTGRDNEGLRDFGESLVDYLQQVLSFLVYATDDKPWPFASDEDDDDEDERDYGPTTSASNDDQVDDADDGSGESVSNSPESKNRDDVFADMSFTDATDTGGATGAVEGSDENIEASDDERTVDYPGTSAAANQQDDVGSAGGESDKNDDGETKPSY